MKELTRPERPEILQHYIAGQDAWMDVDQGGDLASIGGNARWILCIL